MNDESLEQLVNDLPKRIEPRRDLWPDIEARLGRPKRSAFPQANGLAAAVLVAACALGVVFGLNQPAMPVASTAQLALPALNPVIARNIKSVDRAIGQIRQALQTDPTSPALQDLLFEAYNERNRLTVQQTKLNLIRSYTS